MTLVQQINLSSKEIDTNTHKFLQDTFDFMNKDFYHLEPMLVPMCPETPIKITELDI